MLGSGVPALDISVLIQFVITALVLVAASILLVKKAASRYLVVDDGSFEPPGEDRMSIGGGSDGHVPSACAMCGTSAAKKCSRCKSVWYCSQKCQSKHWKADHMLKCKQVRSSDEVDIVSSGNGSCRRRKSSGFGPIALVPACGTCKVLQEPKKILFPYDEFVKLFNWDKPGFPPCGLLNCGNSCFVNVVLQCLACTRPLIAYLLEKDHCRGCIRKRDNWCFLCELQVHIQRASESSQPFSPRNILSQLPHIGGNLGCGRQEDAHEFMRFAIDTMQSVCLDEYGGEKSLDPSTQETTLIQHIFGGHLQSQVICTKCNMVSNRYDNMMDLTVEIHGDAESLEECLDQFTVKEWLDGENMYKCDGCNDYVKAWKRLTVHQAPNILTIALKRFQSGRFGKLNKRITFPESLDLTPYMSGNGDGTDLYTLYAVVVHLDMLNASFFGHYICYTKDYHGQWYRIDDYKVMNVEVEEVLSQGAYMLLYSRRNARREPFVKPVEPARRDHLAEVDIEPSNIPKAVIPTGVLSCLPSDAGPQSNLALLETPIDVSLLRDTGHERELKTKNDATEGKETEDMDVMVNPEPVPIDLGDVNMDVPGLRPLGPKDLEEGNLSLSSYVPDDALSVKPMRSNATSVVKLSSIEVKAMECEESCDSFDADFHNEEDNGSIISTEEAAKLSGCTSAGSFSSENMFHNMAETSTSDPITSVADRDPSDNWRPKLEQSMVAYDSLHSASEVNRLDAVSCGGKETKVLASRLQNGARGKPKPLFSRGFLDRPARKKSVDHERKAQTGELGVVLSMMTNGYSNGHSKLGIAGQSARVGAASLESLSENGFLNKSYRNPTDEYKIGKTNCKGFAELASTCPSREKEFGPESSYSSEGTTIMRTNGSVCAWENGSSVHKKDDVASRLVLENNSNGDSKYNPKPVSGTRQNEQGRFGQLNGLHTDLVEEGINGE